MSMLKELVSKGVRLIVTEVPEGGEASSPPPPPAPEELQTAPRPKTVYPKKKTLTAEEVMADPPLPRTSSAVPATVDDARWRTCWRARGSSRWGARSRPRR
jgi:hypothetical protein